LALPSHEHLPVLLLRRNHRTAINGWMHISNSCKVKFLSGVNITQRSSYASLIYPEWRCPFSHCPRHSGFFRDSRSCPCWPIVFRGHAVVFFGPKRFYSLSPFTFGHCVNLRKNSLPVDYSVDIWLRSYVVIYPLKIYVQPLFFSSGAGTFDTKSIKVYHLPSHLL
jgi:hypothetical protein